MKQHNLLLLLLITGCTTSPAVPTKPTETVPDWLQPMAQATRITLYSIDGTEKNKDQKMPPAMEEFRGYPVLGKIEIKSADERAEVVQALKQGTENLNHGFARCFWPRHALRVERNGKITDYVICFECFWIKAFLGNEVKDIVTSKEPQELLNQHLKKARIAIAP